MFAPGWKRSVSKTMIAGLALSGLAITHSAAARDFEHRNSVLRGQISIEQSRLGWRNDGWNSDRFNDSRWRGYGPAWNHSPWAWEPAPRYRYAPRNRASRVDPWEALAWGVGAAILFEALTDHDRDDQRNAYNRALSAPVGESIVWNNANNNTGGEVRVTRDGTAGDKYCREFQQTITVNGQQQNAWGISCQEPDGSWKIVPQN